MRQINSKAEPFRAPRRGRGVAPLFYGIGGGYRYDASNVMEVVRKCKYAESVTWEKLHAEAVVLHAEVLVLPAEALVLRAEALVLPAEVLVLHI